MQENDGRRTGDGFQLIAAGIGHGYRRFLCPAVLPGQQTSLAGQDIIGHGHAVQSDGSNRRYRVQVQIEFFAAVAGHLLRLNNLPRIKDMYQAVSELVADVAPRTEPEEPWR